MREGLEREHAQRALPDLREDRVAKLLEPHRHEPRHAVGDGQPDRPRAKRPGGRRRVLREPVDGGLVEERGRDRDELGHEKRQKRGHDTLLHPGLTLGPEIGHHLADGPATRSPRLRLELGRVAHEISCMSLGGPDT